MTLPCAISHLVSFSPDVAFAPPQMSGDPDISFTEPITDYDVRETSKIFGTPTFVTQTSVPGIISLPCYPHLVSTVLSIVVETQRSNLGFGDFFVAGGAKLISSVIKIAQHLHYMGAARAGVYEQCRKSRHIDLNSTTGHPRCPLHCPTRWFSVVAVLEYCCNPEYRGVISMYITVFNGDEGIGKDVRGTTKPLPVLSGNDWKEVAGILEAVRPYQHLNTTLQTDKICFGGAALILDQFISTRSAAAHLPLVVGEAVRVNLLRALKAKIKRTDSIAHQLTSVAAEFLTPACARITHSKRGKGTVMNALTFVVSIFEPELILERR